MDCYSYIVLSMIADSPGQECCNNGYDLFSDLFASNSVQIIRHDSLPKESKSVPAIWSFKGKQIKDILSLITGLKSHQLDCIQAYTQAPINSEIYMNIPGQFIVKNDTLCFSPTPTPGNSDV
jgi:hypothetical protein